MNVDCEFSFWFIRYDLMLMCTLSNYVCDPALGRVFFIAYETLSEE